MTAANEALGKQSQLESTLDAGIEAISQNEGVQFQKYIKFALAPDSSVFWIATKETQIVSGSLHYATDRVQEEDQTIGTNQITLTSKTEITKFNLISPLEMWIGAWPIAGAAPLLIAFSSRGNYYQEANIFHYLGFAVYPAFFTQVVQSASDIPAGPITSNSLSIWLEQNSFAPVFPSFLVPDNFAPPYIVAHIEPSQTQALGAFPLIGPWPGIVEPTSGASPLHELAGMQLYRDEVTLTLYGFTNQTAVQYLQSLIEASIDGTAPFGFMNSPAIQDAKRTQVELATLAQKKTIQISADYYLYAADAVARRLILSVAVSSISFIGGVVPYGNIAVVQATQTIAATGTVGGA